MPITDLQRLISYLSQDYSKLDVPQLINFSTLLAKAATEILEEILRRVK